MISPPPKSLLWIHESMVNALLLYYDYPHPKKPGEIISGYDKEHALRTAKMCAAVAQYLGHDEDKIRQYQVACLLHDLGRAGLDQDLFGKIWSWARKNNIPTRPGEWRTSHPDTPHGEETEAFLSMYQTQLQSLGINMSNWAKEQVEMRLGYARRLHRVLEPLLPQLKQQGIEWLPWMEQVVSYYYYPEKLDDSPEWVRELGETLMACEQLEAYSNRIRGSDYYDRKDENVIDAFNYLDSLKQQGRLSEKVLTAVRDLTAQGLFDNILTEARATELSKKEFDFLRTLNTQT